MSYDSRIDTLLHIKRVSQLLTQSASELIRRANVHDDSKLESPEKELFDELTPILAGLTYGSEEYKESLSKLKPALDHHYANNSHHPEFYGERGVNGMDLFDLLEMFVDWKAAGERHNNGNIYKSIQINKDRFGLSDQLVEILTNTAERLGYEKPKESVVVENVVENQDNAILQADVAKLGDEVIELSNENAPLVTADVLQNKLNKIKDDINSVKEKIGK